MREASNHTNSWCEPGTGDRRAASRIWKLLRASILIRIKKTFFATTCSDVLRGHLTIHTYTGPSWRTSDTNVTLEDSYASVQHS